MRYSVAMTADIEQQLSDHLLRADGQEDVLAATYVLSTGSERTTAIIGSVILPYEGERLVHGTASFTSTYVLRAANQAHKLGHGLVLLHSHPRGGGWQGLSPTDHDTESDYERVARQITRQPLLGMTLAGRDGGWSARWWFDASAPTWAESVRSVSTKLSITWNRALRPAPKAMDTQLRTLSSWGHSAQESITSLRVLVVGVGSVGLDVAQRLAATGLTQVDVMDLDTVEPVNLDRMIGATRLDAALSRPKVDVAARLMRSAATAPSFEVAQHRVSICDPAGLRLALNYDVIFSCVDRPWPRAVLNALAYTDLIPVIDGGIALDTFSDGRMRGGIWRTHTVLPGQPCMLCLGQLVYGEITLDQQGLLEDPRYIASSHRQPPARQNVAALSASVSAGLLAQFVSLTAHPGGRGVPAPLRFILATHHLEHSAAASRPHCPVENEVAIGDQRTPLTRPTAHPTATPATRASAALRALAAGYRLLQSWEDRLLQRALDPAPRPKAR